MADKTTKDWDPESYAGFRGLRLRPALDLLAQVPDVPAGDVVDLGCGDGAVGADLRARFAGRRLTGVDTSSAMLEKAEALGIYDGLTQADVALWAAHAPPALVFSNACLHWLPDHASLMPRLAQMLGPRGVLAVQMPRQQTAASHALLRETAAGLYPDRFDFSTWKEAVARPEDYARLLAPFGDCQVWETKYLQRLAPAAQGHPVRHFTQSTAMRPFAGQLGAGEYAAFVQAYEVALEEAYPKEADGSVLFAFKRLFFVLVRPADAG